MSDISKITIPSLTAWMIRAALRSSFVGILFGMAFTIKMTSPAGGIERDFTYFVAACVFLLALITTTLLGAIAGGVSYLIPKGFLADAPVGTSWDSINAQARLVSLSIQIVIVAVLCAALILLGLGTAQSLFWAGLPTLLIVALSNMMPRQNNSELPSTSHSHE